MAVKEKVQSTQTFFGEVQTELKKVAWPKREEVIRATITTLIATGILAIYLAVTDLLLERGIRPLFTGDFSFWTMVMGAYFSVMLFLVYKISSSE